MNLALRRHKTPQGKFMGLQSAFSTSSHRLTLLLQAVESNYNARNHPERGQALFAAVWFADSPWAILCSPTHATLVQRQAIEAEPEQKMRNDQTVEALRGLFESSPIALRRPLNDSFYESVLRRR